MKKKSFLAFERVTKCYGRRYWQFCQCAQKIRRCFQNPSQSEMLIVYQYACTLRPKYIYMLMPKYVRINLNCKNLGIQMCTTFICVNSLKLQCTSLLDHLLSEDLIELSRQQGGIKLNVVGSYLIKERPSQWSVQGRRISISQKKDTVYMYSSEFEYFRTSICKLYSKPNWRKTSTCTGQQCVRAG